MDFMLIQPDALRSVWDRVRAGLDLMPTEDWIPEDVYHAIRSGESALYLGANDAGYAGFFVLRRQVTEFSREPVLHVWLAHNAGNADVFSEAQGFITKMAREMGCKRVTFGSPRKGWAKRFPLSSATYDVPMESTE